MEKHAENDMDGISLDKVLDVMREMCSQKRKCTFERVYAAFCQQHKNVSRKALVALLETAVMEKKVEKRVTNNLSSYRVLDSAEYGRQKSVTSKCSSRVLAQVSDGIVSTLAANGNTDSKRSLSLKCIEQKISSEGRIRVLEDFDWSRNIRLVCRQLVSRGILQRQGARYHLVPGARHKMLNTSWRGSEVIDEQAGITRGQKHKRFRVCNIANADDKDEGCSSNNNCKLMSDDYHVIGEVLPSKVAHSYKGICDSVQKAVVKQKTRTLLHHARGVGLKTKACQKPGVPSGRKNFRHKKYQLRSSVELAAGAKGEPFSHRRRLLKGRKQYSLCSRQSDIEGQVHLADGKDTTAVKDANKSSSFSTEKFKQSSENLHQNTAQALPPDKSYSGSNSGSAVARSTRNHAKSRKSAQAADNAVATSVVDSLISVSQPFVNLCRVESTTVENNNRVIIVDDKYNAPDIESNSRKDSDDSNGFSGRTRKIPICQLASASEVHGNTFIKVKKMLL